jgi:hypothetical protein
VTIVDYFDNLIETNLTSNENSTVLDELKKYQFIYYYFNFEQSTPSPVCEAQKQRDALIQQLSPVDQNITKQIIQDVQFTAGAVIQIVNEYIHEKYSYEIEQILNSSDSSRFMELAQLLGYNNSYFGSGPIQDVCALESDINDLVNSFSEDNKLTVQLIVSTYVSGLKSLNSTVITIVDHFDYIDEANLANNTLINQLKQYQYIYNYLKSNDFNQSIGFPSSFNYTRSNISICEAQKERDNLISQLSPSDQNIIIEIILDVQFTTSVALEKLFEYISSEYGQQISEIENSTDSDKLKSVYNLLQLKNNNNFTYNLVKSNNSSIIDPIQDLCAIQTEIINLVNTFLPNNKPIVLNLLNTYLSGLISLKIPVVTIVDYFDNLIETNLTSNENSTVLDELKKYQFIYGFFNLTFLF